MAAFDASESLTPFKTGRDARDGGRVDQSRIDQARVDQDYGAILCDAADARQVAPEWFLPAHWGDNAHQVTSGGRGGAWFVDTPAGPAVLRLYLRGGWAAGFSRNAYLWRGAGRVRSFQEFRLTRSLHARGLPVPRPIAACYRRHGLTYRAAILVERLQGVHTFAERVSVAASDAPWEETGRLIARFHRAGLDHADLNAHNILFDADGHGWLIDFDKGRLRIPATRWRERNLGRLRRSLLKLGQPGDEEAIDRDFERLRGAYHATWSRGF